MQLADGDSLAAMYSKEKQLVMRGNDVKMILCLDTLGKDLQVGF